MLPKIVVLVSLVLLAAVAVPPGASSADPGERFTLTILHNNDASSRLLPVDGAGGVARFKALVDSERGRAPNGPNAATVVLSAGNNIEVGPNLEASVTKGVPFYDAVAMRLIGYDAAVLGDQEFGLGPDVLADLVCSLMLTGGGAHVTACDVTGRPAFPFLSANLDFAAEPRLQGLVDAGAIAPSTVVVKGAHRIGIVGVTTPLLAVTSSPRGVAVMSNTALAVQAQVDSLQAAGVDKIVLLSQLQTLDDQLALAPSLRGVDVIVAGGTYMPDARYPVYASTADGVRIPVATVPGGYESLGKLVVQFDGHGDLVSVDPASGAIAVADTEVRPDNILVAAVEAPVQAFLDSLSEEVIATSEVALEGRPGIIRAAETNLGDLMADAALWQARQLAPEFGVSHPDIAILNAGGFRLDMLAPPGPLSHLETYEIAPFASFISVVEDVSPAELKLVMENALSKLPRDDGRFAQIAGFTVTYDPAGEALAFDEAGTRTNDGARVLSIELDDGTDLLQGGEPVAGAPDVTVATIDFLARGGDQYPFAHDFTTLGVSYQQALEGYVIEALGGVIGAAQYPEGGSGRLVAR